MDRILALPFVLLTILLISLVVIVHDYPVITSDVSSNQENLVYVQGILQKYDDLLDVYRKKISILEESLRNAEMKKQVCEFLSEGLQEDLNDTLGNIPMQKFKERLSSALKYNPDLESLLDTDVYRYSLTLEARQEVDELIDEKSYKDTVENIQGWIKNNIKYVNNRRWYTAKETWDEKEANCNGMSFLTCGMMREAGIPCKVVANSEHAWIEYLYIDGRGRMIWSVWDQGNSGYSVLNSSVYENDL
ncbi:MAG: transglutaminase-like domain-containing protein [Candidatus Aenigmarchaeota archaeon]|nr:transglutaminase-like domain-containing protein [Candidatus Aenigmarchaeota archaeon]